MKLKNRILVAVLLMGTAFVAIPRVSGWKLEYLLDISLVADDG